MHKHFFPSPQITIVAHLTNGSQHWQFLDKAQPLAHSGTILLLTNSARTDWCLEIFLMTLLEFEDCGEHLLVGISEFGFR